MQSRTLGIALCLAAAGCLVFAAFSQSWLARDTDQTRIGYGLRTSFECIGEHCEHTSNAERVAQFREWERPGAPKLASSAFVPFGWVTFVDLLAIAVGLIAAAVIGFARKQPELRIAPTTLALAGIMLALISGCVFVATKPGPNGMVGVGLGFWVFGVGCVLGIAGSQVMAKVNRPPDPDLMADAMNPDDY